MKSDSVLRGMYEGGPFAAYRRRCKSATSYVLLLPIDLVYEQHSAQGSPMARGPCTIDVGADRRRREPSAATIPCAPPGMIPPWKSQGTDAHHRQEREGTVVLAAWQVVMMHIASSCPQPPSVGHGARHAPYTCRGHMLSAAKTSRMLLCTTGVITTTITMPCHYRHGFGCQSTSASQTQVERA